MQCLFNRTDLNLSVDAYLPSLKQINFEHLFISFVHLKTRLYFENGRLFVTPENFHLEATEDRFFFFDERETNRCIANLYGKNLMDPVNALFINQGNVAFRTRDKVTPNKATNRHIQTMSAIYRS